MDPPLLSYNLALFGLLEARQTIVRLSRFGAKIVGPCICRSDQGTNDDNHWIVEMSREKFDEIRFYPWFIFNVRWYIIRDNKDNYCFFPPFYPDVNTDVARDKLRKMRLKVEEEEKDLDKESQKKEFAIEYEEIKQRCLEEKEKEKFQRIQTRSRSRRRGDPP